MNRASFFVLSLFRLESTAFSTLWLYRLAFHSLTAAVISRNDSFFAGFAREFFWKFIADIRNADIDRAAASTWFTWFS